MYHFANQKFVPNASIKGVAYRNNLYGKDGEVEILLSKMESIWASAIYRLIDGVGRAEHPLDDDTVTHLYRLLLQYIIVSITRTAKAADENIEFYNHLEAMVNEVKQYGHKLAFNEEELTESLEYPNIVGLKSTYDIEPFLYDLVPLLIVNNSNRGFITSDNPVAKYNQFYIYRNYKRNYGLSTAGLQIFLPLSPDICLCLYDGEVYSLKSNGRVVILSSGSSVNELNKLIVENAYAQAFFWNSEKESYIRSISRHKKIDEVSTVQEYPIQGSSNTLLWFGNKSTDIKTKLPFFEIKPEYLSIALPAHMGGLTRSATKALELKITQRYRNVSFKLTKQ